MNPAPRPGAARPAQVGATAPRLVAILGAESTGKSTLCSQLRDALMRHGHNAVVVPEYLREWCHREGRTPQPHEQWAIANEQARRIQHARPADLVIADTTPLMTAVYSDLLFGDTSLQAFAIHHQQRYALTLVTGLDIDWVEDGLQRDGRASRPPVDARLRSLLRDATLPFTVVYGQGMARMNRVLPAVLRMLEPAPHTALAHQPAEPVWDCERCSQPGCEHRLFSALLQSRSVRA